MSYQLNEKVKIFTLDSNPELAHEVASYLNRSIGKSSVSKFSDGEIQVNIDESVRGCEVYIVQSTSEPVNERLMELLIMIDALKRASAEIINVVIPYYGYGRQDRKAHAREPITAKLIANLLETAGATRMMTMDLHTPQIQGFFNIPIDPLTGIPVLAQYFEQKELADLVVVAPHNNTVGRARKLASRLNAPLALIDRRRTKEGTAKVMNVIGEVSGKNIVMIDDMIDTAITITVAAEALKDKGAKTVYVGCTHPILSGNAINRIEQSPIEELVITNTIGLPRDKQLDKITILSVAPLLADGINRIHHDMPVSILFE